MSKQTKDGELCKLDIVNLVAVVNWVNMTVNLMSQAPCWTLMLVVVQGASPQLLEFSMGRHYYNQLLLCSVQSANAAIY